MRTIITPLLLLCAAAAAACDSDRSSSQTYQSAAGASENTEYDSPAGALKAADALRAAGANAEAMSVAAGAYRRFPYDPAVVSAYGRLALINGNDALAARLLKEATAGKPDDWRALSALGVLDSRNGRIGDGHKALVRARAASGENAVTLNNLAVSCLLDGKTAEAAALLRQALTSPLVKPEHRARMTRNLALALAVEGNFTEADTIAGQPMPRELQHAGAAAIRRFMGLDGPAFLPAQGVAPQLAGSWQPAEAPAAE